MVEREEDQPIFFLPLPPLSSFPPSHPVPSPSNLFPGELVGDSELSHMLHIAQPRRASSSPARITPSLAKGAVSVELVADPLFSLAKGAGLPSSSALTPTIQSRQIVHLACCCT